MFSTPDFLVTQSYLLFLLPAILIYQIGAIGEYVIMVFNKNYIIMYVYIVLAVLSTILNLVLIPLLGLEGAAIAMLFSFICYGVFNILYARRLLNFGIDARAFIKIFVSAFIMVLSIYFIKVNLRGNQVFFCLPFSCLIYLAALYVLGCFSKKEISLFKSVVTNFGIKENLKNIPE
jgi:O-antigen/teichoic acid export membrane protein